MKMKKKRLQVIAGMLAAFILAVPAPVSAAETDGGDDVITSVLDSQALDIDIDQYQAEDGVLKLYLNHNEMSDFALTPDMLTVMLGENEMKTLNVQSLYDANVPISYRCIVDVSGSMSQDRIDEAKEIIKDLASIKKPVDSIGITTMGNELVDSDYMTDPDEIAAEVDKITLTQEDTNLYYAITEELNRLQTNDKVQRKRCLVIFSDGADDQGTGITREEAEKAAEESHIPIFTVALMKNKDNEKDIEMAKILGSFARMSAGGAHFNPLLEGGNIDFYADSIMDILNKSFVTEESIEDIDVSGKEALLKVTVSTADGQTASDSLNVPESEIKIIKTEQEQYYPEPTVEPVTEEVVEEPEVVPEPEKTILGLPVWLFIVLLIAIAAGVIALILFLVMKNRAANEEEPVSFTEQPEEEEQETEIPSGMQMGFGGDDDLLKTESLESASNTVGVTGSRSSSAGSKRVSVTMTRMGGGSEQVYECPLDGVYTIGRSASKSKLAITSDSALSGLHCSLLTEDNRVFIRDEKSMNGTFVNGVPIDGKFELHQDDVVLIGSYEYRISWK